MNDLLNELIDKICEKAVDEYSDIDMNTRQCIERYLIEHYNFSEVDDKAYELSHEFNDIYLNNWR